MVKTVPRTSVGAVRFEEYEGRNDFDVVTDFVVKLAIGDLVVAAVAN